GLPAIDASDASAATALLQSFVMDDTIPLRVSYGYDYDPENAHQFDYVMGMHLDNAFTLDASGTMRNVPLEELSQMGGLSPEEAQGRMMAQMAVADVPAALWT